MSVCAQPFDSPRHPPSLPHQCHTPPAPGAPLRIHRRHLSGCPPPPSLPLMNAPACAGNGLTCHREWETLYAGRIPIVRTSHMDPMYQQLPVLIVSNWTDVTKDFLVQQWGRMAGARYNFAKLWEPFWLLRILRIALQTA